MGCGELGRVRELVAWLETYRCMCDRRNGYVVAVVQSCRW